MFHPIDIHVGKRVRFKRKVLGYTQSDLADKVELTFQQIQKYEKGENRISASKLYQIAEVLNTNVSFFFEGYANSSNVSSSIKDDKLSIELINAFSSIKNDELKKRLLLLINSVSETNHL